MAVERNAAEYLAKAKTCEAAYDLPGAFEAYQTALTLAPDALEIVQSLANLAFRLGQWDMAERFFAHMIKQGSQDVRTYTAFAATLREQSRYDEAISLLKDLLWQHPDNSHLWESLGNAVVAKGDVETAIIFYSEALRLQPHDLHARLNRGCAYLDQGNGVAALSDLDMCKDAFTDLDNRASAQIAFAQALLWNGDLSEGWRWYKSRERKGTRLEVFYDLNLPRLPTATKLAHEKLFISLEQGLGDEVLFASMLPDIQKEITSLGHLGIGVEPRLKSLFQRSFPDASVLAHHTKIIDGKLQRNVPELISKDYNFWALIGDFFETHRSKLTDFPAKNAYLVPDPDRIIHWKRQLSLHDPKPKIGLVWKSLKSGAYRDKYFSAFAQWTDILALDGVTFVNLQYGNTTEEMAEAKRAGFTIVTPDSIDLKDDLDDLAALCSSMDLILGPSNATSNIAAACGVPVWFLTAPVNWLRLGQKSYPWYPSVRLFQTPDIKDWTPALDAMRAALLEHFDLPRL